MSYSIGGIQQLGVGIPNVEEAWAWYRKAFGMDIMMFREAAEAPFMTPYTGGKVHARDAVLAVNMNGGGGFEIWQYTSRETQKADFDVQLGDTGIYGGRIKSKDIKKSHDHLLSIGANVPGDPVAGPDGKLHFFVFDPYGNVFDVVEGTDWYAEGKTPQGGVDGAMLGVTNIEKARVLYSDVLGFDNVVYDEMGAFDDLKTLPGGEGKFRRVLLERSKPFEGPFAKILGPARIELFMSKEREPKKIFQDRFWGDWGFIHLCFDIVNMGSLEKACTDAGFPFTVDSGKSSFDMGEAAGHFSYIEDPDGTLIEFVETHKIPIVKKIGWYKKLKGDGKPLPDWMLKSLRFMRVKD